MTPNHSPAQPYALSAGQGWIYSMGVDFCVKAGETAPDLSSVGHGAAVLEYQTRKGEEPETHSHATEDEMFYVLEGNLTFHCGDAAFDLQQGGFIFLPGGIPHGYTIPGDDPVRLLVITTPARSDAKGWGGFVADMEAQTDEMDLT